MTNRSFDLTCQESLGSQTSPTLNVSANSDVVPTAAVPQDDENILVVAPIPLEEVPPIPLEKVCGSFDSQTDCQLLFDLSLNNDDTWQSYHERLATHAELASYRFIGLKNLFQICGIFKAGTQTIVTAVQYFDIYLSKTDVSSLVQEDARKWSAACVRMAIKVVKGDQYHNSDWAKVFPPNSDLSMCEVHLAVLLKWQLCVPTSYTLFHCLKQILKLGLFGGDINKQCSAENYTNELMVLTLQDPRFLKFDPYLIAASVALVVYSLPQIDMPFFKKESMKGRVERCRALLLDCIAWQNIE